jgi:pimeloyl-ACP methyl ester carboxylesterase
MNRHDPTTRFHVNRKIRPSRCERRARSPLACLEQKEKKMTSNGNVAGTHALRLVDIGGDTLETTVIGQGEPVVLVHGAVIADAFAPLVSEPLLADRFQLISYHRRGYARSTRSDRPLSMSEQAADCLALMDALGIDRAHVVGHSLGGLIALQLALDAPKRVHSLVLLEAAPLEIPSLEQLMAGLAPVVSLYQAGQAAEAIDAFERAVIGPEYHSLLDVRVPGAFTQAVADADTFFAQELPALGQWHLLQGDAVRIGQPVLVVMARIVRACGRVSRKATTGNCNGSPPQKASSCQALHMDCKCRTRSARRKPS